MLQNSIANIEDYPCILHRKQKITHVCTQLRCNQNPFLCAFCFNQNIHKNYHISHEEYLSPINQSLYSFSSMIQSQKGDMDKLLQLANRKQNENIFKKIQLKQGHYQAVNSHIRNLKLQVDKQIESMIIQFQKKAMLSKQNIFNQLDNYQKGYIQNMETFKLMTEPISNFKKYKNYVNINNISLKLITQLRKKSIDWFLQIKKYLNTTTKILDKSQSFYQTIRRSTEYINLISDQLPSIKSSDYNQNKKQTSIQLIINEMFGEIINLKQVKVLQNPLIDNMQIYRNIGSRIDSIDRNRLVIKTSKI